MSMHEMLAQSVLEPEHKRGIFSSREKEMAEFFRNPPKAIFVPDCYIPNDPEKARAFMEVRASLVASILHSPLYTTPESRPVIMAFAGVHEDGESSGSEKVAGLLLDREIPAEKLIALTTTITGRGDVSQLHALKKSRDIEGPIAYIASDGYAKRARQVLINHKRAHPDFTDIVYVIYPKHPVVNRLQLANDIGLVTQFIISENLYLGSSGRLRHGPTEGVAWTLSAIPVLRPLQQRAEERSHEGMRHKEQSRYVADKMKDAARRLRFYRRIIESDGHPYRSTKKGKLEPDANSAMELAPGLYTRIADRGGPNDKEQNIQAFAAKIMRFPDMPAHG